MKEEKEWIKVCSQMELEGKFDNTSIPMPERLIVIGDIHGDLEALRSVLVDLAQVADTSWHWIGVKTNVVFVGDMVDSFRPGAYDPYFAREEDDQVIVEIITQLSMEAMRAGGRVIKVLGNHELMNLSSNFASVPPRYRPDRPLMTDAGKPLSLALSHCGLYPIMKIGDWIFAHASITASLLKILEQWSSNPSSDPSSTPPPAPLPGSSPLAGSLERLALIARNMFRGSTPMLEEDVEVFEPKGNLKHFMWDRTFSRENHPINCKHLSHLLDSFGFGPTSRLVVAHTTQFMRGLNLRKYIPGYVPMELDTHTSTEKRMVWTGPLKRVELSKATQIFVSQEQQTSNPKATTTLTKREAQEIVDEGGDAETKPHPINSDCEGRVWRIDVGMSRSFDMKDQVHYAMAEFRKKQKGLAYSKQWLSTFYKILAVRTPSILEVMAVAPDHKLGDGRQESSQQEKVRVLTATRPLPRIWLKQVGIDHSSNPDFIQATLQDIYSSS